jgi:hypothetical protein
MSCRSTRNVIVAKGERAPFPAQSESLLIGREYRSVDMPNSVPACLYVALSRGKVWDREGA